MANKNGAANDFLWQKICNDLEERIRRDFLPDQHFGKLSGICEEFSVSMITARRVFNELSRRKLIRVSPRIGAVVMPQNGKFPELCWLRNNCKCAEHFLNSSFAMHVASKLRNICDQENILLRSVSVALLTSLPPDEKVRGFFSCDLHADTAEWLRQNNMPTVWLNPPPGEYRPGADTVRGDLEYGGYLAGKHLVACGCADIAVMRNIVGDPFADAKCRGLRRALKESGLDINPELVRYTAGDTLPNAGEIPEEQALKEIFSGRLRPDGIFCVNDYRAAKTLEFCRERRIAVPRELCIVGFDNIDESAMLELTTIDLHVEHMLQEMLLCLRRRIGGDVDPERNIIVKPQLIIRKSSALQGV